MRVRRAFTVLEVLVVVALLAIVIGLAAPTLTARSSETTYRTSVDFIRSGMTRARAEAMRRGEVVTVVARTETDGRLVLLMQSAAEDDGGHGSFADADADEASFGGDEVTRMLVRIPRGVSIDREPPSRASESLGFESPQSGAFDIPDEFDDVVDLTIASFLPDGSAASSTAYLFDDDGRIGRIRVNRLTGQCRIEPHSGESDIGETEEPVDESSMDEAFMTPEMEDVTDES